MCKLTVGTLCAQAKLIVCAEDVWLDLDVVLVHDWLLVARVVIIATLAREAKAAVSVVHLDIWR